VSGRLLTCLALALVATGAQAGTSLWVTSEPGEPVGGGVTAYYGSADGVFTGVTGLDTVDVKFGNGPDEDRVEDRRAVFLSFTAPSDEPWKLVFAPPALAPGSYVGGSSQFLAPGAAHIAIGHLAVPGGPFVQDPCAHTRAQVTIHELVLDARGGLLRFAADFVQLCTTDFGADFGTLRGSVRYHFGDNICAGVPDGKRCDDGDACSPRDVCRAGECVGNARPPSCDPASCSDGDLCTDDAAGTDGVCASTAVTGGCWALAPGRMAITAAGRTCGCTGAGSAGVLALHADGSYAVRGGRLTGDACPSRVGVTMPDEVGRWRRIGRSRLGLRATNVMALVAAAKVCAGENARVGGYRTVGKVSSDGQRLKLATAFTVHVQGVSLAVVSRSTGTLDPSPPPVVASGPVARIAADCAERITRCFSR
jgi:hypothetical protein